jgi:hypothetical protein
VSSRRSKKGHKPKCEAPPTPRQLSYLRVLCDRAGHGYTEPSSRRAASLEIDRLLRRIATDLPERPEPAPTASQLHDLKVLASRLGTRHREVQTRAAASLELTRLRREGKTRSSQIPA